MLSTKRGMPILIGGKSWHPLSKAFLDNILSGLYSENGPPTHLADRLGASIPNLMTAALGYRSSFVVAEADK